MLDNDTVFGVAADRMGCTRARQVGIEELGPWPRALEFEPNVGRAHLELRAIGLTPIGHELRNRPVGKIEAAKLIRFNELAALVPSRCSAILRIRILDRLREDIIPIRLLAVPYY